MATTSVSHDLEDLGLVKAFSVTQHISQLQASDEIKKVLEVVSEKAQARTGVCVITKEEINDISAAITSPIGIKQLLETLEMAQCEAEAAEAEAGAGASEDGGRGSSGRGISTSLFLSCLHVRGF
jgi:hypothetical protein